MGYARKIFKCVRFGTDPKIDKTKRVEALKALEEVLANEKSAEDFARRVIAGITKGPDLDETIQLAEENGFERVKKMLTAKKSD